MVMSRGPGEFMDGIPEGAVHLVKEYEEVSGHPNGEEVFLNFERDRARFSILLTEMTETELDAFQDFIALVTEAARPIVRAKDQIVKELFDEYGDDSFPRVYRGVPKLHVRQGEEPLYSESLRRRPFGILEVEGRVRVEPIAGASDRRMAELQQEEQKASHGDPEAGERESVGEVGRTWPATPRLFPTPPKVTPPPDSGGDGGSGEDVPGGPF